MPRTQQNLFDLRESFGAILGNQKDNFTDTKIPELLRRLGLDDYVGSSSKREHLRGAVEQASDDQLVIAAGNALTALVFPIHERDELQELVWDDGLCPTITTRYRRDVAQSIEGVDLFIDRRGFEEVLADIWRIDDVGFLGFPRTTPTLREQIIRHYIENNDWNALTIFDKLGAFQCSNARFGRFIEALASSRVRPNEQAQRVFIEAVNGALQPCGVHFVDAPGMDGYLVASLATIGSGQQRSPKNLIFASPFKPDLRFSNALDNDVEVVTDVDKVLVYDRPISAGGLLWRELQTWFAQTQGLEDEHAKEPLYRRLQASLPNSSPPQMLAFTSFYKAFPKKDIPNLPALLPEVWFHWDPQTVAQRGKAALLRSRMDFLLLLPGGIRVIVEVDGKHHYSTDDGRSSPQRYSEMMAADRALKLVGYEVYRFGGEELSKPGAETMLIDFYRLLFKRYSLLKNG
jgi:very-short-patch-repair endonuclease